MISRQILAIEIEPAVLDAVQGPLAERFDHVYQDEKVELVNHEARSYMEKTDRRFDLIYLPSVGGYPQMMLEPGNMIRTIDAFETLRDRLTERGTLAIWYPSVLDPKGILTEQYIRTLEGPEVGLQVRGFRSPGDVLILAAGSTEYLPTLQDVQAFYYQSGGAALPFPMNIFSAPMAVEKTWESRNLPPHPRRSAVSRRQRPAHFFRAEGRLSVRPGGRPAGRLRGAPVPVAEEAGKPGNSGQVIFAGRVVSLFVGANFLVIEHFLILALFRKLYVYHDAVVLGAIGFLIITGLGSTLITARWRPVLQLVAGVFILFLLLSHEALSPWANLALLAPVAFVTGSFFPALFEAAAENPLGVFAADSIGAAIGSMASFFIPIVFGFSWFFAFATAMFWLTAVATYLFFRNLAGPVAQEGKVSPVKT